MTAESDKSDVPRPDRSLEDRLRGLQPPVPANLEAKLLAAIPKHQQAAVADTGRRRRAAWVWAAAAGGLAAAAVVLVTVLTQVSRCTAPPDSRVITAGAAGGNLKHMIQREETSARLLASTRILAGQDGTEEYVSRTLAYIAREYPDTIAAREIAASNKKQGAER